VNETKEMKPRKEVRKKEEAKKTKGQKGVEIPIFAVEFVGIGGGNTWKEGRYSS